MTRIAVFVGVDYHQKSVQVCVVDVEGNVLMNRKLPSTVEAILAAVGQGSDVRGVAIEACCGAADLAEKLVQRAGWSVSLAHPGYVARMKQNRDKTDFGDARVLADLLRVGYLPKVWLAPKELRQLRHLVRLRQDLVAQRRKIKLQIRALLRENRIIAPDSRKPWTCAWLAWLRETDALTDDDRWIMDRRLESLGEVFLKIRAVEKRLRERAQEDAVIQKLCRFHGVGLVTSVTMRAEIGQFDRFATGKQLARFCGLSPRNVSSGERQADAGLVKAGNTQLRVVVIETAQRLLWQPDNDWARLAMRLLRKGKPRNVVVAAVANRWVRWLYHQMQPERLAV
jgi:transposase